MYPDIMLEAKIGEMLTIKYYFYIFNITIRRHAAHETKATIIFFLFRDHYSNRTRYSATRANRSSHLIGEDRYAGGEDADSSIVHCSLCPHQSVATWKHGTVYFLCAKYGVVS